jgi:hypothetical protein
VKVAWLTHRAWDAAAGGAEACDVAMVQRKPKGVEVTVIWPGGVDERLLDFDRVVVSGFYGYRGREFNIMQDVGHKTTLWNHDVQMEGHWFPSVVKNWVFCSPGHRDYELSKQDSKPKNVFLNPGWMDLTKLALHQPDIRRDALWAHRPVEHKGLDLAANWSRSKMIPLDVMVGQPRDAVLRAMTTHKYFVLLSHIFDAAPLAVMEAQILGCELVVNENVGRYDDRDDLIRRIDESDKDFWEVALA